MLLATTQSQVKRQTHELLLNSMIIMYVCLYQCLHADISMVMLRLASHRHVAARKELSLPQTWPSWQALEKVNEILENQYKISGIGKTCKATFFIEQS